MNLEDMVTEEKYPILSLFVIAEDLREVFEEYSFLLSKSEERREFLNKVYGLIELITAVAEHLENIRQEFKAEVDNQYA